MNPDRPQAIQYLRAPASGLWRWADDGTVVAWHDGTTVAFRVELMPILEWLGTHGLPPFGSLVLLLAASRGKVPELSRILRQGALPLAQDAKAIVLTAARRQLAAQLEATLQELRKLFELPADLRSGLPARCVLAEAIFEGARAERYVNAATVLRGWREVIPEIELNDGWPAEDASAIVRQVHVVAEGCRRHTPESLRLRLRTGLDALPKKVDLDLPPAERARRLIEELSGDPVHGPVARAARDLMAAVRLPRHLGEREELAIDGLADLTNRGPLDRLLLSELAHDDLTLAVRVALNEALFLRREPPLREPPGTLGLLLDSGVRLWGVPRVLAAAVGLALAACDRRHARVLAWRSHGREVHPLDLLTRKGFIEHLEVLEVEAHPGAALPAFAAAQPAGTANQTVVVTHRDALEDPEFRRALAERVPGAGFVATVDRSGTFELHALPLTRRPPHCAASLDLEAIFEPKSPQVAPLINPALAAQLPAIFRVSPFPLLLPFAGALEVWTKTDDGDTCVLLSDRRLIRFSDHRTGGWLLAAQLPAGKSVWMGCVDGTVHLVKAGTSQRPVRLVSVPARGGAPRVVDLLGSPDLLAVHRVGEVVLLIRSQDVRAFALADGRPLGHAVHPHRWIHGRFFASSDRFYATTWDGSGVRLEPVTLPHAFSPAAIALVFDREGTEGPWLVHRDGEIISCASDERIKLRLPQGLVHGIGSARASADGHRVFVSMRTWGRMMELSTGRSWDLVPSLFQPHDLDPPVLLPHWNVYRVIDSISAEPGGGLWIRGRKGRWREIHLDPAVGLTIRDLPESQMAGALSRQVMSLSTYPISREFGCTLRVARWPSGSRMFIDSRGLLHLKSHDPSVREVSLVLSDGEVAGWLSDGVVCGPRFFLGAGVVSEPQEVQRGIEEFLQRL